MREIAGPCHKTIHGIPHKPLGDGQKSSSGHPGSLVPSGHISEFHCSVRYIRVYVSAIPSNMGNAKQ